MKIQLKLTKCFYYSITISFTKYSNPNMCFAAAIKMCLGTSGRLARSLCDMFLLRASVHPRGAFFVSWDIFPMKQKPPVHSNENHISHPNKLEVFYLTKFTSWIYLPFISGIITADAAFTRALPASFPSYLAKFLMKRLARSFAFSSHSASFA